MISWGIEVELLSTILFLFLYDSSQLLHYNEVVFRRTGRSWTYQFAAELLEIRGKHLFVASPLRLHARHYSFYWSTVNVAEPEDAEGDGAADSTDILLVVLAYLSCFLLFLALPSSLLITKTHDIFIAVLSLVYASALLTGLVLYFGRADYGLSEDAARTIAIEISLCPAFAPNVLRKAHAKRISSPRLIEFAQTTLSPNDFEHFQLRFIRILDEELGFTPPESPRREGLVNLKRSLLKEVSE